MLLTIDKPTWITSYDAIRQLKRAFPKRKIWHSGTLDPMATGLLIIWIDKDTKQLGTLQWFHKSYITTIDFSKMSDTRDMDFWEKFEEYEMISGKGQGISKVWIYKWWEEVLAPSLQEIEKKLSSLVPSAILQLTPFSAKKKDGQKLYDLARKWEIVQENREMKVMSFSIFDYSFPLLKLRLDVGTGTYIRSIGYWLGREFGLGGILTSLRRISIWDVEILEVFCDGENCAERADGMQKIEGTNLYGKEIIQNT